MSDAGVPIEDMSRLVGHTAGSAVTETINRKQLRPMLLQGAEAMDETLPNYGTGSVVTQLVTHGGKGQRSAEGWGPSDLRGRYKT